MSPAAIKEEVAAIVAQIANRIDLLYPKIIPLSNNLETMLLLGLLLLCESATIRLNDQILQVELAQTSQEKVRGLMGRKALSDREGMLFVYDQPRILCFWMKGMQIPISIAFFDEHKVIIGMDEMPVMNKREREPKNYCCNKKAKYALEMAAGWFKRYGISVGDRFEWVSPPPD